MDDDSRTRFPCRLGYRFPAEWEPRAATWLAWPHNRASWPGRFDEALAEYIRFVRVLAELEPVHILAGGPDVMRSAEAGLGQLANITLHEIATNDAWIRDSGPTFLTRPPAATQVGRTSTSMRLSGTNVDVRPTSAHGAPTLRTKTLAATQRRCAVVDWQYNAWGGKYPPFDRDNEVPQRIAELLRIPRFAAPIVLEGGSIETNGAGTMLTTTTCLLNPNRNPRESRQNLERYLREFVGASKVIWLAGEIAGDDTDGHIDQLARFVNETTVVACCESDAADENYLPLRALASGLRDALTDDGQVIDVVFLPMPRPVIRAAQRLPASYANFYITDSAVLVPQFSDPADDRAIGLLREQFPQRDAIGLPSRDLVLGLGGFHCLTQQQPADGIS